MNRPAAADSISRVLAFVVLAATGGIGGCGDDGRGPQSEPDTATGATGTGTPTPVGGTEMGGTEMGGTEMGGTEMGGTAASGGLGGAWTSGLGGAGETPTTGGTPTGGTSGGPSTGGSAAGGIPTGGVPTGGMPAGGVPTGGMPTGGVPTGGTPTGGVVTGGASTGVGGGGTGGIRDCEYSAPPVNVAAWVEESWTAQLGDNIANRQAWLIDNAIMGEGEINLCVRWGATSAPSTEVKSQVGPSVQRWLNDWFQALGDYGCFPYPEGVTVRVTGWAVRPGNESWVNDLGSDVGVYTETDGEGEPKCPDTCSFFTNWDHRFPNCEAGETFHTDYWIWVSDQLPGSGAAAVGGDWGLRMPVSSFVNSLGADGNLVIEHEMGHGFGFQDYYDWTGSTPEGGSLMIVGSTNQGTPTVADTWLIRRTWEEMVELRGWTFP